PAPRAAHEMRLARVPRGRLGGPAEVVTALLAEAPESVHERAHDDAEAPHHEERAGAPLDERFRRKAPERERRSHDAHEEAQVRQRLGADHGALAAVRLTSLSSMMMRRFFAFASAIALSSAGVSVPLKAGTSRAGVLSACVQMTT